MITTLTEPTEDFPFPWPLAYNYVLVDSQNILYIYTFFGTHTLHLDYLGAQI